MKIHFESDPTRFHFPFRIFGNAGRYDTITGCVFLDASHIVCADRQMAKLYLYKFDLERNTALKLDEMDCIINETPFHFEILCTYNSAVYAVAYTNAVLRVNVDMKRYKFTSCELRAIQSNDLYHGIAVASPDAIYLTNMKVNTITEYNWNTGEKNTMICEVGVRMKSVVKLDENHILALSSDKGPVNGQLMFDGSVHPNNVFYNSHIFIYNKTNGRLIDKFALPNTQIDDCTYDGIHCYVTCAKGDGSGYILRCKITDALSFADPMQCEVPGFPHGIDYHKNVLAFTSYSESSLTVCNLSDLIFTSIQ